MTRLTSCLDAELVAERAAAHIQRALAHAREQRGVAHVALSGGTSPGHTYELLARSPDTFENVEIWFADERCVPPEDEESNYRLARQTLLDSAGVPAEQVHRMEGELGPEEGARRYAALLAERVPATRPPDGGGQHAGSRPGAGPGGAEQPDAVPVLDLIVLGIGPDGHVASLFPGAATLDAPADEICLGVSDSPKPPPERITLSMPVLQSARECLLLATGAGKADAVSAMLGEATRHVPASLLRRGRLTVIVDGAAAPAAPPR